MTWNYRVVIRQDPDDPSEQFGIHEVYYDSSGQIEAWTEEPCTPFGESLAELAADIEHMGQALSKPPLKESELIEHSARRAELRSRTTADEDPS
jgi:hypothetical protein